MKNIKSSDSVFEKVMQAYERVSKKYYEVFRALAKDDMSFAKDLNKEQIMQKIKVKKV